MDTWHLRRVIRQIPGFRVAFARRKGACPSGSITTWRSSENEALVLLRFLGANPCSESRDLVFFGVVSQLSGLDFGLESISYEQVCKLASKSEESGFDALVLSDHVFLGRAPHPETWTTIAALSLQTKRIRIGTHVAVSSFHFPSLLAKMAANVDRISRGRLHFGIGAGGWGQDAEQPAYGIPFFSPSERIRRLREAVLIIREMFTRERATFEGQFYSIRDALCEPKPLQRPLPVWIGGSGRRLLAVAAELADGWDTGFARLSDYDQMRMTLDTFCEQFGRKASSIQRACSSYWTIIARDQASLRATRKKLLPSILANRQRHHVAWIRNMREEEYLERRFALGGTVEEVVSKIQEFARRGVTHFFFSFADFPGTRMLELFADKVMPAFRR